MLFAVYGCQIWCHFVDSFSLGLSVAYYNALALRLLLNVPVAVLVIYVLNMMLILFTLRFVSNSILYCFRWLTVRICLLRALLNLIDFYSPC